MTALLLGLALGCLLPASHAAALALLAGAVLIAVTDRFPRPTLVVLGRDYRVPRSVGLPTAYHRKVKS